MHPMNWSDKPSRMDRLLVELSSEVILKKILFLNPNMHKFFYKSSCNELLRLSTSFSEGNILQGILISHLNFVIMCFPQYFATP